MQKNEPEDSLLKKKKKKKKLESLISAKIVR